jgi:ribokinase
LKTASSVLVIGSANTDMSVKVARLPRPGETILGGKFTMAFGGKGANQAVGAARAGADVTFIARIGNDSFGNKVVAGLAADGINNDYLIRDRSNASGVALIFIDEAGENSIAVAPGSNGKLTPADLKKARKAFTGAGVLLLQLEIPMNTVEAAVEIAAETGMRVILNPAPARALPPALLRRVSVLTPNAHETELLTGIRVTDRASAAGAASELLSRGVEHVVITLGAEGAYIAGGAEGGHWIPAHKVNAVDTTAAGDIFNGALSAALARNETLVAAAFFANAASAVSVTRMGAQPSAPTRTEIERMLAANRNGHSRSLPAKRNLRYTPK